MKEVMCVCCINLCVHFAVYNDQQFRTFNKICNLRKSQFTIVVLQTIEMFSSNLVIGYLFPASCSFLTLMAIIFLLQKYSNATQIPVSLASA